MRVSRYDSVDVAIVLDKKELIRLYNAIKKFSQISDYENFNRMELTAECSDGMRRHFTSVGDLLRYENPSKAEIQSLIINGSGYKDGDSRNAEIKFRNSTYKPVDINISGPEREVSELNVQIDNSIDAMRPWYSYIAITSDIKLMLFITIMVVLSFIYIAIVGGLNSTIIFYGGLIVGFSPLLISSLLNALRRKYFPIAVFAVGQGAKRYDGHEKFRVVVIVGFIISVLSGVVVALIL